jgi:hypothetical protein
LRAYGLKLKTQREHLIRSMETLKQNNALMQILKNRELQENNTQLQTCESEIVAVEENMKLLSQQLQQVSLYFSGSEVTADV